ncbi:MAG: hypothetical protein JWO36_172 [Myxococcales bacterium]|nr:hypothetical protein [Myxococcales bacterium]
MSATRVPPTRGFATASARPTKNAFAPPVGVTLAGSRSFTVRHMRTTLMICLLAGAACKDDKPAPAPAPDPTPVEPTPAAKPLPPKPKHLTEAELGTCHLTASGAVTADQTTPGGRAAANISYWMSEADQKKMMGVDGFVINCIGSDIRFQLVPGGGKKDGMPFKPKKYDFEKGKGDANLMIAFGKTTLATPSGSIDITSFDSHHIAGSIELAGKLTPGGGDEKLTGNFDLACAGFSACDK